MWTGVGWAGRELEGRVATGWELGWTDWYKEPVEDMFTGMLDILREEGEPLNTPGRAIPDIGCVL